MSGITIKVVETAGEMLSSIGRSGSEDRPPSSKERRMLTHQERDGLSLIKRSIQEDGWAMVSKQLWPIILSIVPNELIEIDETETEQIAGKIRFSEEGKIVMKWLI